MVLTEPVRDEVAGGADLRGNTDGSFDRGIRYLVKNRLLEGR